MKSPICFALDIFGIIALAGAGLALVSALWFTASVAEPVLLTAFTYCLMATVSAFLAARMSELARVFATAASEGEVVLAPLADNVEQLADHSPLQRAA